MPLRAKIFLTCIVVVLCITIFLKWVLVGVKLPALLVLAGCAVVMGLVSIPRSTKHDSNPPSQGH